MVAVASVSLLVASPAVTSTHCAAPSIIPSKFPLLAIQQPRPSQGHAAIRRTPRICCSAANRPSPSTDVSSTAKIRSEVLSPFRSVRMFFYLAFMGSGSLGGLIAFTQLIPALANSSRAGDLPEILKGLGIDIGAVLLFAFLYTRENNARNSQVARLSREENLSKLKLRVDEKKKTISIGDLRGIARLVILAGPASYIAESFLRSKTFTDGLLERGILVVPFATDGSTVTFEFEQIDDDPEVINKKKKLWQLGPLYTSEWTKQESDNKDPNHLYYILLNCRSVLSLFVLFLGTSFIL